MDDLFTGAGSPPKRTRVVATGKTFDAKDALKGLGFRWDFRQQQWFKMIEDEKIDDLFEQVEELGLGVRCEFDDGEPFM